VAAVFFVLWVAQYVVVVVLKMLDDVFLVVGCSEQDHGK
jgi:hypothetical protein